MSGPSTYQPQNAFLKWFEARLPIGGLVHSSFVAYPTPKNLNYWWTFGAILSFMLGVQIVTGIVLAMHYTPHVDMAFNSVEHIMRDVNYGWLLRYLHSNGASMFFVAVYIHMFRGLYYGSYKEPREVLWILGVIIYLLMMATGFLGYTLPWGQMSFWGATVITNFFSAIPLVGESVVTWLWGGYAVGNPTLQRFFSLHYLLPFVIAGVVVLHVWALHVAGQNNPTGIEPKSGPGHACRSRRYATMKDGFMVAVFCLFFAWFVFYVPNYLGHADNYIQANPGVTPTHIVPEWYYLPFYAILRSIPNKLAGVVAMFGSILVLAFLPWLDTSRVKSATYRPLYRQFFWVFVLVCLGLGYLGSSPAEGGYVIAARILTAYYFIHFLIILPLLGLIETPRPLPNSISESVLKKAKAAAAVLLGDRALAARCCSARPRASRAGRRATIAEAAAQQVVVRRARSASSTRAQLQRGFKVYKEVCQTCHGLKLLSFGNLADPGGPGFSVAQARPSRPNTRCRTGRTTPARCSSATGGSPTASRRRRPGRTRRRRARSTTARCRRTCRCSPRRAAMSAASRWFLVDALPFFAVPGARRRLRRRAVEGLQGPAAGGLSASAGGNYNEYFPGHSIAMPPPLTDGRVEYTDGSPATVDQYAKDVAAFMMWAAEPHLEARKRIGFQVMIFLLDLRRA